MKKINYFSTLLFVLLGIHSAYSQCNITGLASIPENTQAEYEIATIPGASYFWSVTGVLTIVNGNTGSSVQVGATGDGQGTVCVTRFQDGAEPCCDCLEVTVTDVPPPPPPPCIPVESLTITQIEIPGEGCPGDIMEFQVTYLPNNATFDADNLSWEGGTGFVFGQNAYQFQDGGTSFFFATPLSGSAWVGVEYTSCDDSTVNDFVLVVFEIDCPELGGLLLNQSSNGQNNGNYLANISPNPFKESTMITMDIKAEVDGRIEIYNLAGELIFAKETYFIKGQNKLEIKNLPQSENGLLIYNIKTGNTILESGKMLKIN